MNSSISSTEKTLDTFFSKFPSRIYKKGEVIIQAHTNPQGVIYIESGIVRNYVITEKGTEITLNLYKAHSFIPMSWVIGNVEITHFFDAFTQVHAKIAPKNAVMSFLKQKPDVLFDLLQRVYRGMEGIWKHIISLSTGDSYKKLLSALIILSKRFGVQENGKATILLQLHEQDIANYAGISRETASRELQKLKKDHVVSFEKGTLSINNMSFLEEELGH